jgi:uncharacterized membrane protein
MAILEYIAWVLGILGIVIITWGILRGTFVFILAEYRSFTKKGEQSDSLINVRIRIGQYLLIGLEFLIGADIIRTFIQPSLEEIAILASIVVIRTIISYFLNREMKQT